MSEFILTSSRVWWAIGAILLSLLVRFLQQLHYHRRMYKDLPGPPHSYILGHLKALGEAMMDMPKNAHPQGMPQLVKDKFNLPDVFYLDAFPFGPPTMVITDPEASKYITITNSLPKHEEVRKFMSHIGGPGNLVSTEGHVWKKWRSAFNPGFSANHVMSLVPAIVDDCLVFCDLMQENAKTNKLFRMERATTKLTVDIIGRVVLDLGFDSQHEPNPIVDSMITSLKWMRTGRSEPDPLASINIFRPLVLRYETWKMSRYLGRILEERFASRDSRPKSKAVIDLALTAYLKENKGTNVEDATRLDPEFKTAAISNLKTFIFAGHDTTSSTIVYAYYYLFKNPEMLAKIRKEHDNVFGPDPEKVADQLKQDAHLLNKLPYTLAVIREVLRYQPPASTIRGGLPGVFVKDPKTGRQLPTEGFMIWPVDVCLHRNPNYWPNPNEFNPDRHLATSDDGSANYNSKDAWVAFSKGPRNCIGQELAIIETKIILALTMRSFDFFPAFDEVHKLKGDGSGYPSDTKGVQTLLGDEAYQVVLGTAKPREGMPCRLKLRN